MNHIPSRKSIQFTQHLKLARWNKSLRPVDDVESMLSCTSKSNELQFQSTECHPRRPQMIGRMKLKLPKWILRGAGNRQTRSTHTTNTFSDDIHKTRAHTARYHCQFGSMNWKRKWEINRKVTRSTHGSFDDTEHCRHALESRRENRQSRRKRLQLHDPRQVVQRQKAKRRQNRKNGE